MLFSTNYIIFQWEDRKSPIAELNYAMQTPTGRLEMRRQHMQGELLECCTDGEEAVGPGFMSGITGTYRERRDASRMY